MYDLFSDKNFPLPPANAEEMPARITEVHRELCRAVCAHGEVWAKPSGGLRHCTTGTDDLPCVGDYVYLRHEPGGHSPITAVMPRRSKFSRPDGTGKQEQLVATNFDFAWIVTSLNLDFNLKRIERYLTAAWQSGAQPVVLLTKADLCADAAARVAEVERIAPGVPVHALSVVTGEGMEALAAYTQPGTTMALLGMSGVGKSSLVNALMGQEQMLVRTIREGDSRGRHTTTHRQLLILPGGAMLIDTPGMRELGLWDVGQGLSEAFSDIEALAADCRFDDCAHEKEPGCAVRAALAEGRLEAARLKSYQKLAREAERKRISRSPRRAPSDK